MIGTVKKKTDRGFGFISMEGQDKDLFFHSTALNGIAFDELQEGAQVTFDVVDAADGRQSAKNVQLAGQGGQSAPVEETVQSEPVEAVGQNEEAAPAEQSQPAEEAE